VLFPTRILVGVDRSEASRAALAAATELALATDSELHLIHVKSTSSTVRGRPVTPTQGDQMDAEAAALLSEAADHVTEQGASLGGTHVRFAERPERLLTEAQGELDAGLLVVGASRSGSVARSLMTGGDGASSTVRRSGSSVLVVRPPT
jgi:nucleotide-binding universal stress UspA family protein